MLLCKIMGYSFTDTALGIEVWKDGNCVYIGRNLNDCYKYFTK